MKVTTTIKNKIFKKRVNEASSKTVKDKLFPLVGIGASAGGLEAITQLLQNLPSNTGMSFIYVSHLSPDYKSMLASLLSKSTRMKVHEARNGMSMDPNNFYVIPPDKEMAVADGHIKLSPRKKDRQGILPIDIFFSSLAEKHKEYVIGIILSGSGNDGTRGLKIIKQEGGLTFAQDDSAKFSNMPQSAISQGAVDFVLSPKEIAQALVRLSKSGYVRNGLLKTEKEDEIENKNPDLKIILQLLYKKRAIDFSHYKMNTIRRRMIRRMQIHKVKTLHEYAGLLNRKKDEIDQLCKDLLINVTYFFRDPDAFLYLKNNLFPKLLKRKSSEERLRIWIPACSTGEEVYSIAMTILELQRKRRMSLPVQIFATDLSAEAIVKARIGEYSEDELKHVSPQLLGRYFIKIKDHYRVGKILRDSCVFAQHNILSDPPFSQVDFISCCNLLIYLDTTAQKKVIATFHYALKDNGYLMLGKSETIGNSTQLFSSINKKLRIYLRKKNTGNGIIPSITPRFSQTTLPEKKLKIPVQHSFSVGNGHLGTAIDSVLLSRYIPTCVIINHDMEILEFRGSTELYLRHSSGRASFNIIKMARPEIAFELRNAIHIAIKSKKQVHKKGIEIRTDSTLKLIHIEVDPVSIEGEEPLLLVIFSEQQWVDVYDFKGNEGKNAADIKGRRIKQLEKELSATRADNLSITHDYEATIEELQSANEEVVSNNEELRTLNEELETSKEEIESTNEELISANQKLQAHYTQIEELHQFSETIIATIHHPVIVLDKEFRIKAINKPFYQLFHISNEIAKGAKLFDLNNHQWKIPHLRKLIDDIIPKNTPVTNLEITHTFKGLGEKILLFNGTKVTQKSSGEQLIVLAIEDITEEARMRLKEQKLMHELQEVNKELEIMNSELTAFNYVSSHDLQEPLRKIKTFANFILKEEYQNLSPAGIDYFNRMQVSADHMKTLIEDLLLYSRTIIKERKFEKTDLDVIVNEVKEEFSDLIKEKKATIKSSGLCHANVVRFQFRQLIHNLMGNALKFSNPGRSPKIVIKSKMAKGNRLNNKELSPQVNYCHISFSDNGIGFDPQYKDRIFELFERLHNKDEYKGTGIGLALCKKIIKNHNGFINATSKIDKGTRFDIYIPA